MTTEEQDKEFEELYSTANLVANLRTTRLLGEDVMKYPCGFAWIIIKPANSKFSNWLKRTNKGTHYPLRKGITIWITDYNQSADHKALHAVFMAQVLQMNGQDAEPGARLD